MTREAQAVKTWHELKTWPEFFEEISSGRKLFEIRENDRDFKVGDGLWLREYTLGIGLSGRDARAVITYMTDWKQQPRYVVLGVSLLADVLGSPTSQDQNDQEVTRVDRQCDPTDSPTAAENETTPPIAVRYFEFEVKHGVLETDVEDALIAAMGVDLSGPPDAWKWPFSGWCFDWYDESFELHGTTPGWAPTSEQLAAAWALGFGRCWICYTDGMERYAARGGELGPPNQRGVKDVGGNYERIKRLEKQLAALTASAEVVSPQPTRQIVMEERVVDGERRFVNVAPDTLAAEVVSQPLCMVIDIATKQPRLAADPSTPAEPPVDTSKAILDNEANRRLMLERPNYGFNRCVHHRMRIDDQQRTVKCGDCDIWLDPVWCLRELFYYYEKRVDDRVFYIKEAERKESERAARTKERKARPMEWLRKRRAESLERAAYNEYQAKLLTIRADRQRNVAAKLNAELETTDLPASAEGSIPSPTESTK